MDLASSAYVFYLFKLPELMNEMNSYPDNTRPKGDSGKEGK